jgi:Fuc2NAc and GlcNAc transferase
MTPAIALAAGASALLAFAGAGAVAACGPMDRPRPRGSHSIPTATSGGLAVIAAAAAGLWLSAWLAPGERVETIRAALAVGFAGLLGLLGAVDDLYDLGAKPKLLVQLLASLAFAGLVARAEALPIGAGALHLGLYAGLLGSALWLVVVANAVNFMDGSDGLAAGSVAIALAALGLVAFAGGDPVLAAAAFSGAAALLGFLPWNLPIGRLFQGDAGSLFGGFLLAALALVGAGADGRGAVPLWLVPTALTPFLTDVLLTLLARAREKKPLFEAHREHNYQLWLSATGNSHAALALRVWLLTAAYALAGALAPRDLGAGVFAVGVALAAAGWVLLRRKLRTPG